MTPDEIFDAMGEFVVRVFPDATPADHMRKLSDESLESAECTDDIMEFADCLLCIYGAAFKSGFSYTDLHAAAMRKLIINRARKWRKLPDGTYQHIKNEGNDRKI
jgi:phage gp29-like protein